MTQVKMQAKRRIANYSNWVLNVLPFLDDCMSICDLSTTSVSCWIAKCDSNVNWIGTLLTVRTFWPQLIVWDRAPVHHRRVIWVSSCHIGSIFACTTSCWLVKLDRPVIESPGLITLNHSLCAYCKITWSSPTHALIWCSCQLGKGKGGNFWTEGISGHAPSFHFHSLAAVLLTTVQHWRVPIYILTIN